MAQPQTPKDLSDWMASVEKRLKALGAAARSRPALTTVDGDLVVNGSISLVDAAGNVLVSLGDLGGGLHGIQVDDDTGVPQIRLGELQSGGYGLEAIQGGTAVPLANLAYGIRAVSLTAGTFLGPIADTGGAFVNGTGGPSVAGVTVGPSGRMLVTIGALISPDANTSAAIGYALSGAGTVAATGLTAASYANDIAGTIGAASVSATSLLTGLTPGTYTVTAKYLVHDISGSGAGYFDNRFIVAQPY